MYGGKAYIETMARDYYILHYASPEEATRLRKMDKIQSICSTIFLGLVSVILLFLAIRGFIYG